MIPVVDAQEAELFVATQEELQWLARLREWQVKHLDQLQEPDPTELMPETIDEFKANLEHNRTRYYIPYPNDQDYQLYDGNPPRSVAPIDDFALDDINPYSGLVN